ncbi:MAG: 50S ribosomal protein L22 [Cyanobacteria bacterium P01_A01_bin.68]
MNVKRKERYSDIQSTAKAKLRVSPQKLNEVASMIRNMRVSEAVVQLQFCKRRISNSVLQILNSAIANAENNNGLDPDYLFVKEIYVGKSFVMKRFRARARGRGARILKPFSNILIILEERQS